VDTPYYIEYRIRDVDELKWGDVFGECDSERDMAACAGCGSSGDYKQDSYMAGKGMDELPCVDEAPARCGNELWLNNDRAYIDGQRGADAETSGAEAIERGNSVDDFAKVRRWISGQTLGIWKLCRRNGWTHCGAASALYGGSLLQKFEASADFSRTNRYLVNTEGDGPRGKARFNVHVNGNTQAADGMTLNRG